MVPHRARAGGHQLQHAALGDGDVRREEHGVLFLAQEGGGVIFFFSFRLASSAVSKIDACEKKNLFLFLRLSLSHTHVDKERRFPLGLHVADALGGEREEERARVTRLEREGS